MNGNTPPPRQGLGESDEPSVRKKQPDVKPPRKSSTGTGIAGRQNKANKDENVMNWLHPSDNRGVLMESVKSNPDHYGKLERQIGSPAKIKIQSNKIVLTKRVEEDHPKTVKDALLIQPSHVGRLPPDVLQKIVSTSGASLIWVDQNHIEISGTANVVEKARQYLLDEVFGTSVQSVSCPQWVFELITYYINEACWAFPEIQITNNEGKINIMGHPNEVNRVHEKLKAIIAPYNEAQISVRKEYHKCIIGRNGQKFEKLQNRHEVSVIVPFGNCDDTSIIIRGMGYHVKAAQLEIENWVAGVIRNKRSTLLMPIQPSHRCRLKNATLQNIKRDHGVSAKWQPAGLILLTGPNERLKQAQNALVQELESTETKELQVLFWLMSYLKPFINKEKKTWPEVTVTNTDNSLRICGHRTEVLPFHSNLSKTLRDLEESKCFQTIQVSRKFHGVLIGKKGQTIKRLKSKYNVEIKIPDEKADCDEVTILGDKGKVEAAQLEIENLVAGAMRNERSTLLMPIRPSHRPCLKNATFQRIKRDHGVDAKWQSEGEVLLTGPNEKLKQAQDALSQELEATEMKELQVLFWLMSYLKPFINEEKKNWPEVTVTNTDNGLQICGHRTEVLPFHSNLSKKLRDLEESKCFQTIQVSRKFHGVLIGKKGQTISRLTSKYNVEIKIPDDKEGLDEVTVLGDKHDVEAAEKEILEIIHARENSESKAVQTPNVPERHLASCIADLRKQFPEIKIEKKQKQRSITLIGNRELVDRASLSLQEKFNHLKRSIKTVDIPMESSQLLGIVGWKHSNLKQLQAKYKDISIRYDVRPPKVTIEGEEEKVEKALIDIVAMLPSLMGFCVAEIKIQIIAKFIGKVGSNITRLKADFPKVGIETPRRESGDDCVIVFGKTTDVRHFVNCISHYGITVVRCHTEVPERRRAGPPGSFSPQKQQMWGSQSSLSSCMSSNYEDGYDSDETKRFIDSLVVDELDVRTYGAFNFLSDSTIGLQIKHIGVQHNCTILVEPAMDTVWKDRRFICLPAEMVTASLFGSLTVSVEEGDIAADGSDMIVNTSDKSFSFRGPLSRAIFSKGGEALKTEFLSYGRLDKDVGVTSGGSLKCKKILHVAIPASNESMEELVHKILKTANDHAMTSITLPTIGAGGGGWSYQDVAVGIRQGIAKFVELEPSPMYLKKVKVMLFSSISNSDKKSFYDRFTKTGYGQETAKPSVKESQPTLIQRVFSYFSRQPKPEPAAEASAKPQDDDNRSHASKEKASEAKKTDHGGFAKIIIFSNNDENVKAAKKEMEKFVGQNLKTFVIDSADILKLKQAHIKKLRKIADEQKVRVVINGENKNHVITIQGVNEYASHAKEETQRILSGFTSDLPETWCGMPDGQKVMKVPLSPSSAEYQKVERRFTKANVRSMYTNFSITKIERVQNPTLYRQYQSKKAEIAARSSTSGKIDRKLFHGTDSDTVNKIYNDVFNRSYAGKNATLYGKGVYFSTQSSYSDSYTAEDHSGTRQMFLARVLTGDFCKGESSMVDAPTNPRTKELYDSVVDNEITPTMFVVFRDWSVYPLYIITYRRT